MKKVAMFFATGFEEVEAITVVDYLRRGEIRVDMISTTGDIEVIGDHKIKVSMDLLLEDMEKSSYDAYIIPGGMPNAKYLSKNERVLEILKSENEKGKLICAVCAGPMVLVSSGVLKGKTITGYPGLFEDNTSYNYADKKTVKDQNIITSQGPSLAVYFALEIIEALEGKGIRKKVEDSILLERMEK